MNMLRDYKGHTAKMLIFLVTIIICNSALAQDSMRTDDGKNAIDNKDQIEDLNSKLNKLEDRVSEIRRDQLNYKIEKDLLKETFSSNYQTINIVLTIILGIFTLISILGFRDIAKIRREYLEELAKFNNLRKDLEIKFSEFAKEQEKTKEDHMEITKTYDEFNRKIKILEIQEKISSLNSSGNYRDALEFAAIGLEIDPRNTIILSGKALAHLRLGEYSSAISVYNKILEIDPIDYGAIVDLLELYLIMNNIEMYDNLYNKFKDYIDKSKEGILTIYFDVLKSYQRNDLQHMQEKINTFISELPSDKLGFFNWNFDDIRGAIRNQPDTVIKKLFLLFIKFLDRKIDLDKFKILYNEIIAKPE